MATPTTSNMYSYQQRQQYPPQQEQQLVPHYGPSYDPFQVNQNQQYPQQQAPPAFNPSYYYSPTSAAPANEGIPAQVHTRSHYASDPSMISMSSTGNMDIAVATEDNDIDIPDEIIKSQEMAWKSALERNSSQQQETTTMTTYSNGAAQPNIPVPRSRNPSGSDAVHPYKQQMKEGRKVTTAAAATGGALAGAILTGPAFPVGALIGGVAAGYSANKLHKQGERRAQRKWEQSNFQSGTRQAPIFSNKGTATVHTIV